VSDNDDVTSQALQKESDVGLLDRNILKCVSIMLFSLMNFRCGIYRMAQKINHYQISEKSY